MLKKILEEIEEEKLKHWDPSERLDTDKLIGWCFEKCKDIIRKHMNEGKDINVPAKDNDGWIPVEDQDRLPKDDEYIFLSFENFDLPMVGRYKTNKEGGAFYLGDEEDTCISQDLYVNAWQPLPKPYRPEQRNPSPQGKGEKEENMKLGILNTSILTAAGEYTLKDIDLDTAKDLVSQNDLDSAVGHASTAQIMTGLLGVEIPVNRQQFCQQPGQQALVFKLNGRPQEGKILTEEEIEQIGYKFQLLERRK